METIQDDLGIDIKIGITLILGKQKWLITDIGHSQKLKNNIYIPFSALLLTEDETQKISEQLFWFPEIELCFSSLEEFKNLK